MKKTFFNNSTKKIIFTIIGFAFLASASAQLEVNASGKTWAGPVPIGHDPNNLVTLSLYGTGASGSKSRLSFGDFGSTATGQNVFIGEYGNYNSNQLWLHGKEGFYLTKGNDPLSNDPACLVAYYINSTTTNNFLFSTNVWGVKFVTTSDTRFKSNVTQIQTPLKKLLSLNGVSYDFDDTPKMKKLQEKFRSENSSSFEGEISENTNTTTPIETRLGFIAQDLQKIFPDLVEEDDMGFLGIEYTGLIPVIVEAMKEQQTQIEELKEQNKQLVKLLNIKSVDEQAFQENEINSIPLLLQNTPNPFNQSTEIGYYIPENVNSANIYIYDVNGFQQKNIAISERSKGVTIVQASSLQAGIYFYTLICDGKPVDTKQMILTK